MVVWGWGGPWIGVESGRIKRGIANGRNETLRDDVYVYYFNCGGGFMGINICQDLSNSTVVKKTDG